MRAVEHLDLPNEPVLFRPADVCEFLGHVGVPEFPQSPSGDGSVT